MMILGLFISGLVVLSFSCAKDDDEDKDKPKELTPREKAIKDYEDNYKGSYVADPGWTGNTTNCVAGTLSQDARNKVIQRLNYFRRLVGLSDNVVENPAQHAGCQEASLIFKAQNNLSHFPPASWKCWTQAGRNAAESSNIGWGTATSGEYCTHTTYGVSGFIEDAGDGNKVVGHRSWFLMPGLTKLGIGSTNSTCCMQWKDNYTMGGTAPEFIAYPPKGYIPNVITYPRWSFTLPGGGSFSNAKVTMTDGVGANVSLNIINKPATAVQGAPYKHLVWEPNINVKNIMEDVKYTVTISDVTGATKPTYTYEVIVMPVQPSYRKAPGDDIGYKLIMAMTR